MAKIRAKTPKSHQTGQKPDVCRGAERGQGRAGKDAAGNARRGCKKRQKARGWLNTTTGLQGQEGNV